VGTQLAEGGARIQTIMAILGHRSAGMAVTYSHISDPVLKEQYGRGGVTQQRDRAGHSGLVEEQLLQDRARTRPLSAAAGRRAVRV
jgi:hypothetical protein